ncbi:MAG: hypothetical protein IJ243_12315 [Prevotella sp.]|nr:hypothetical protein [Prevotella sp.]
MIKLNSFDAAKLGENPHNFLLLFGREHLITVVRSIIRYCAQRKATQLERPLASPQPQGCGEKGGDKLGTGYTGAGKKPRLFRWQRTGTILAAAAANNGSGREN